MMRVKDIREKLEEIERILNWEHDTEGVRAYKEHLQRQKIGLQAELMRAMEREPEQELSWRNIENVPWRKK